MKNVVLGVTGSIAAFKAAEIASALVKLGAGVDVIMTKNACEFISPLTFETLTGRPVTCDMFRRDTPWEVEHIALAKKADVFVVAPATANFIGKYANGIADDMLTTTAMAANAHMIIAPAMNTNMFRSAANLENIKKLGAAGVEFVSPSSGRLACGDVGMGRLADISDIVSAILRALEPKKDLLGKRVLITAGPTRETIDPIRFISNRSSGKMGYALASTAYNRGAEVTLVSGPTALKPPYGVEFVRAESTEEMYKACMDRLESMDIIIKAAAPADFTPKAPAGHKLKKAGISTLALELAPTPDILRAIGANKGKAFVCGFAAETDELEAYAREKLERKNLDMIAANDVSRSDAGFESNNNAVTMFFRNGEKKVVPLCSKADVAEQILDAIASRLG